MYGPFGILIEWLQAMPAMIGTIAVILFIILIAWFLIARKLGYGRIGKEEYYKEKGKQRAMGGQSQQTRRQGARFEQAKAKLAAHRLKKQNRLPMHKGNVNKRIKRKYF